MHEPSILSKTRRDLFSGRVALDAAFTLLHTEDRSAGNEGLLNDPVGVKQDQIGVVAGSEETFAMAQPQRYRGVEGGHGGALRKGVGGGVGKSSVEGEQAAGQSA